MQRFTGELRHSIKPVQDYEPLEIRVTCFLHSSAISACKEVKSSTKVQEFVSSGADTPPVQHLYCRGMLQSALPCVC